MPSVFSGVPQPLPSQSRPGPAPQEYGRTLADFEALVADRIQSKGATPESPSMVAARFVMAAAAGGILLLVGTELAMVTVTTALTLRALFVTYWHSSARRERLTRVAARDYTASFGGALSSPGWTYRYVPFEHVRAVFDRRTVQLGLTPEQIDIALAALDTDTVGGALRQACAPS